MGIIRTILPCPFHRMEIPLSVAGVFWVSLTALASRVAHPP